MRSTLRADRRPPRLFLNKGNIPVRGSRRTLEGFSGLGYGQDLGLGHRGTHLRHLCREGGILLNKDGERLAVDD